jgi:hypothetical protein
MPQLRPYKWINMLFALLAITAFSLYFFHQIFLPRTLALTRIRTYFTNFKDRGASIPLKTSIIV